MSMNNGPASVPCLVRRSPPKKTQWKQKIPFGDCRESSCAPGVNVTLCGLLSELWVYCRLCVSLSLSSKGHNVTMGNPVTDLLGKVKSCLSVFGKGQKIKKVAQCV